MQSDFLGLHHRLARLVEGLEAIAATPGCTDGEALRRAVPLVQALVAHDDWLPAEMAVPHEKFYQQHLLYADPQDRFSLVSFVWGPGQRTPVHDHTVWGVIGMLRGAEVGQRYRHEAGRLVAEGEPLRLEPGEVDTVSPETGDVHQVMNAFDDRVSISIHVYGGNIGRIRRHVFAPDGSVKDFVSGYSATPPGPSLLSARAGSVGTSATIAMSQRAAALRAAGVDVISMALGEPDFDTPAPIVEAAHAAARGGMTRYTAADGSPALKQAVREKLLRDNRLAYAAAEIHTASGAKQVIHNAFAATLDPGDEVIVFSPCWVSYLDMVELCGGTPVVVPTSAQQGFLPDPAALQAALTPRTKWVLLNSPNNPSGAVYPAALLRDLEQVLEGRTRVLVLADEIYEHLVYEGEEHVSLLQAAPQLRDRVLLVNGVSKAYAMTGWRIGFAAGPAWLVEAMGRIQSHTAGNSCSVAQAAAAHALTGEQGLLAEWRAIFQARRDRALALLGADSRLLLVRPGGAFYLFAGVAAYLGLVAPDGSVMADDTALAEYLLEAAGVATVAGAAFAFSPFLRLSFALDEQRVEQACRRILQALARLGPA